MNEQQIKEVAAQFAEVIAGSKNILANTVMTCQTINTYLQANGISGKVERCNISTTESGGEPIEHYIIMLHDGKILDALASCYPNERGEFMHEPVYIGELPKHYKLYNQQ